MQDGSPAGGQLQASVVQGVMATGSSAAGARARLPSVASILYCEI